MGNPFLVLFGKTPLKVGREVRYKGENMRVKSMQDIVEYLKSYGINADSKDGVDEINNDGILGGVDAILKRYPDGYVYELTNVVSDVGASEIYETRVGGRRQKSQRRRSGRRRRTSRR